MAIGWLSVLKMVPWGEVIDNAPKVAQGAKKLWASVGKKTVGAAGFASQAPAQASADDPQALLLVLQSQVTELQLRSAELHQQLVESCALMASLAEQNAQLMARVEVNRKRTWALTLVLLGLTLALVMLYIR